MEPGEGFLSLVREEITKLHKQVGSKTAKLEIQRKQLELLESEIENSQKYIAELKSVLEYFSGKLES